MDAHAPSIARPGVRRPQAENVGAWLLGFLPVACLALDGGGYDLVVRSEIGLIGWWLVLLAWSPACSRGPGRRRRPGPCSGSSPAWSSGTWLAADWSSSAERSLVEAGRVAAYGGALVLAVLLVRRGALTALIGGLACAIGLVCALAVLSRLAPGWFPSDPTRTFLAVGRLDYPFNYADAVGEFAAIGLPPLLHLAVAARSHAARALATAGLPLIGLCVTMSVSRGGALACVVGVAVLVALTPYRAATLASGLIAAAAGAVALARMLSLPGLRGGLAAGPSLASERRELLAIVLARARGPGRRPAPGPGSGFGPRRRRRRLPSASSSPRVSPGACGASSSSPTSTAAATSTPVC